MSPSFKGVIGLIIIVLFFFPWVWMGMLSLHLTALLAILIGLVATAIGTWLGFQARKGGSRILGMASMTLGIISIVINVVNLIAVSIR